MSITTTTATSANERAAAAAKNITAALAKAAQAGEAALTSAYGKDARKHAPSSLATAIKYAAQAARIAAGDAEMPATGERRTFIKSILALINEASAAGAAAGMSEDAALTDVALVEAARDVIAADRKRRADKRAEDTARKREQAQALNDAIRAGDIAAAAEAAQLAAGDAAQARQDTVTKIADRFAKQALAAASAGLPLVLAFELLASAYGVESPIVSAPAAE